MKYLIHFTTDFKNLENILDTFSLKLSYCQEEFYLGDKKISSAAHPMVCFSEYDTKELLAKTITYGCYGIAFHWSWVLKRKIEPVLYLFNRSAAANALADLLKARQNNVELPSRLRLPIMTLKCFTKNAVGYNSCMRIKDFKFHEENEWRYVPRKNEIGGGLISQNRSTYLRNKNYYNKKLEPYSIGFTLKDIAVVYVKNMTDKTLLSKTIGLDARKIKVAPWKTK